ncbi:class I SAM-dependent methyltransferase, partial [Actinospica sp. MGRD01-02]
MPTTPRATTPDHADFPERQAPPPARRLGTDPRSDSPDPPAKHGQTKPCTDTPELRATHGHRTDPQTHTPDLAPAHGHRTDPRTLTPELAPTRWTDPHTRTSGLAPTHGHRTDPRALTPELAATRWTDPRVAAAYATRLDGLDRGTAWPRLTELLTVPVPHRGLGRPDATVLDLGSGPGHYARHLAEHHWTATYALDISPAVHRHGAQTVRDAWIHRIMPARDGSLPLRNCQCTGALAHLLICHVREPAHILALLTETRRVLRPGSPLALVEPGDHGHDFHTLRYGHHDRPPAALAPGEAFPVDYALADGSRLRTT